MMAVPDVEISMNFKNLFKTHLFIQSYYTTRFRVSDAVWRPCSDYEHVMAPYKLLYYYYYYYYYYYACSQYGGFNLFARWHQSPTGVNGLRGREFEETGVDSKITFQGGTSYSLVQTSLL